MLRKASSDLVSRKSGSGKLKTPSFQGSRGIGKKGKGSSHEGFTDKFSIAFNDNCLSYQCSKIPTISKIANGVLTPATNIGIGYDHSGQNPIIVICRHSEFRECTMKALKDTIGSFNTITILKLEFCNLKYDEISLLATTLKENKNITEISVSGNTKISDSCDMLLQSNHLLYVTMKFCDIGNWGMMKISDIMAKESCNILHINLASNLLFDESVPQVARILRANRKLISINLADNKITDIGCKELFLCFQKFPLNKQELMEKRCRRFQYYIMRMQLMRKYGLVKPLKKQVSIMKYMEDENIERSSKSERDNGVARSFKVEKYEASRQSSRQSVQVTSEMSLKSLKDANRQPKEMIPISTFEACGTKLRIKRSAHSSAPTLLGGLRRKSGESLRGERGVIENNPSMMKIIERELGYDKHPFVIDSWEEDKKIYCKGNFTLIHMNLSYNKIKTEGLREILGALRYQAEYEDGNSKTGLTKLILEGNDFDFNSDEYREIEKLLSRHILKSRESIISTTKPSSSSLKRQQSSRRSLP